MTPEEIKCFCEEKGVVVLVSSPLGIATCSSKGVEIASATFSGEQERPPRLSSPQEILDGAEKFVVHPKFGEPIELSRQNFERLLRS